MNVRWREQLKLMQFSAVGTTNRPSDECLYPMNGPVLNMAQCNWHTDGGLPCLFTLRGFIHSQLDFSSSNFCGSMKGLSMDLIISSPQYTHSDAMMSSMSDFICSRLVPALPFPRLEVSPSSLVAARWRDFEDCAVAASFFCSSSRRLCLYAVRWGVTSYEAEKNKKTGLKKKQSFATLKHGTYSYLAS